MMQHTYCPVAKESTT